jgi:diacylglycerol kinase (ATP)
MLKSFLDAWSGIMLAVRTQRNVKVQLTVTVLMIGAGVYFSLTPVEWCIAVLAMGLVMGLEVMNTSIEELVNFVSPERREEARRIKDLAAGAVLIAALAAVIIGCIILYSKFA